MPEHPPLLLLHGVMMSANAWSEVAPLLAEQFEVLTPTAAGHRGGPLLEGRATVSRLTDHAERHLDDLGLDTVHVAGNSLGGWMGIELARRGRARSVCALSPAGFWTPGSSDQEASRARLHFVRRLTLVSAPVAPLAMRSGLVRRLSMRDIAVRGDRLTPQAASVAATDLLGCTAGLDLLSTTEAIAPLDPPPCPITLAWPEHDRIFSQQVNGDVARRIVPGARHVVLPGTGHVPMIDDPQACAELIAESCRPQGVSPGEA
ncbi:alpha/beta fold hydrolase [Nocardioides jishulii]|uniref:Alpha/beta hydrolase n=1 Tax=Nocardioides jishulii TaxID=2575440 RepID=A0A4U2YKS3_9ACTN|nr:alpha/beta hydrolase [Nocardioides jishulii]QCX26729.1 alpha/beta hydrolase [Nocardioides jishulii]TKI60301.1 alpha/beta hydrolase [Nocardioides jishulii]